MDISTITNNLKAQVINIDFLIIEEIRPTQDAKKLKKLFFLG